MVGISLLGFSFLSRNWLIKCNVQEGDGEPPTGSLASEIDDRFGSLRSLIQKVNAEGAALQGSGWVVGVLPTS